MIESGFIWWFRAFTAYGQDILPNAPSDLHIALNFHWFSHGNFSAYVPLPLLPSSLR